DFHFSTNLTYRAEMVKALIREIQLQQNFLEGKPVETIYFGGGTPSVLSAGEISDLISMIYGLHTVAERPEITLEANPDDLALPYMSDIRQAGVNRLSIGTQSFHEELLRFMNRSHTAEQSVRSVEDARSAGFDNLNMDLIYAVPAGSTAMWHKDLELMMAVRPEHISAYHLTIEEKTVFGNWYDKGKIDLPEEDQSIAQYNLLSDTLRANGYDHYEVSNFAQPGFRSQHNGSYWKGKHYLGIGPGAHSYNGKMRQYNVSHNIRYMRALEDDKLTYEKEILTRENKINEYLLTGLRTLNGIDEKVMADRFGYSFTEQEKDYLRKLRHKEKILYKNDRWVLTEKGFLLADQIAEDLFTEDHD
ncbi:MAG: radical SAM family heme chaperone HemW, partial [Cyclobacteriaceae bacterium]